MSSVFLSNENVFELNNTFKDDHIENTEMKNIVQDNIRGNRQHSVNEIESENSRNTIFDDFSDRKLDEGDSQKLLNIPSKIEMSDQLCISELSYEIPNKVQEKEVTQFSVFPNEDMQNVISKEFLQHRQNLDIKKGIKAAKFNAKPKKFETFQHLKSSLADSCSKIHEIESEEESFKCTLCKLSFHKFSTQSKLDEHVESFHVKNSGNKLHKCEHCFANFGKKNTLKKTYFVQLF